MTWKPKVSIKNGKMKVCSGWTIRKNKDLALVVFTTNQKYPKVGLTSAVQVMLEPFLNTYTSITFDDLSKDWEIVQAWGGRDTVTVLLGRGKILMNPRLIYESN